MSMSGGHSSIVNLYCSNNIAMNSFAIAIVSNRKLKKGVKFDEDARKPEIDKTVFS